MKFESLTVTQTASQTLITLDDAKAQLRVADDFDDDKITTCMEAAVSYCEGFLWRSFRPQTIVASYSPDGRPFAELMRANFGALVSVKYYDASGTLQTIDAESVIVDSTLFVPRAYFKEPTTSESVFAPIKIEYTTAPGNVPEQIKQAALIATAQFYDDRDAPDLTSVDNILRALATRYFL